MIVILSGATTSRSEIVAESKDPYVSHMPFLRSVRFELYFFPKNFPNPNLTCTVLIPGFGVVSPAFEIC